jgi:hypothetical protein
MEIISDFNTIFQIPGHKNTTFSSKKFWDSTYSTKSLSLTKKVLSTKLKCKSMEFPSITEPFLLRLIGPSGSELWEMINSSETLSMLFTDLLTKPQIEFHSLIGIKLMYQDNKDSGIY